MGFIIDFLSGLVSFVTAIFDGILWFVQEVVEVVSLGLDALATCGSFIGQLPVLFLAPFTAIITIALIFKVKG